LCFYHLPNGHCYQWFEYQVVRVWEMPVKLLLAGGLGTLPLAPLAKVTTEGLPDVIQRMKERIGQEAHPTPPPICGQRRMC
jgi:hypothetical protein